MLPDIEFQCNQWHSVNQLAGIEKGTGLMVVNKNPGREFYLWEGATPPAQDRNDGVIGLYARRVMIGAGSETIWVMDRYPGAQAKGRICVQVAA